MKKFWKYFTATVTGAILGAVFGIFVAFNEDSLPGFFTYVGFPIARVFSPFLKGCYELCVVFYWILFSILTYMIIGSIIGIALVYFLIKKKHL